MNKQTIMEAAKKICNLYVWETAPLKVALGDGICGAIKQVNMEHYVMNREGLCIWGGCQTRDLESRKSKGAIVLVGKAWKPLGSRPPKGPRSQRC